MRRRNLTWQQRLLLYGYALKESNGRKDANLLFGRDRGKSRGLCLLGAGSESTDRANKAKQSKQLHRVHHPSCHRVGSVIRWKNAKKKRLVSTTRSTDLQKTSTVTHQTAGLD